MSAATFGMAVYQPVHDAHDRRRIHGDQAPEVILGYLAEVTQLDQRGELYRT